MSLSARFSRRERTSPTRPLCTPSGFTRRRVLSTLCLLILAQNIEQRLAFGHGLPRPVSDYTLGLDGPGALFQHPAPYMEGLPGAGGAAEADFHLACY